jgi:type IV secretory pathway ATPase VirB11/archaellum biosynthesis ATPase
MLLRRPRASAQSLQELTTAGRIDNEVGRRLERLVAQGRSVLVVGPMGAGRRTVVNALALGFPDETRTVVLERGERIVLGEQNVVRLDAAVVEPAALIDAARGLQPDRIVLGDLGCDGLAALFDRGVDGLPPWLGFAHGHDVDDALDRLVQAVSFRHAGVSAAHAAGRVAAALDVIAVFGVGGRGPVLDALFLARREGDSVVARPMSDAE